MSAAPQNIERLVRAAQQRDHEAFVTLAELVRPRLWARALGRSPDRARAEDIVQETLLRAYRGLAGLKEPAAFVAWVLTIADRLAPGTEQPAREIASSDTLEELAPADESARVLLEAGEWSGSREELNAAIGRLDLAEREILALRFSADLDSAQIGKQMKLSSGAVRTRLCRALEKLRAMLGVKS